MRRGLLGWLAGGRVLAIFFVLTLGIGAGFFFVMQAIGGSLLDMMPSGDHALVRLSELDEAQRLIHFRATITLDVLYPIAYVCFCVGLLCRLAWRWRWGLIWVPIVAGLADLAENFVQAMALSGHPQEILHAKDIVTPLKAGALMLTLGLCLLFALGVLFRKLSGTQTIEDQDPL